MKVRFEVDQATCLRKGIDCPNSIVSVQIDPAKLPQQQRDKIADRLVGIDVCTMYKSFGGEVSQNLDGEGKPIRILAQGPTFEDLWAAICEEEKDLAKPSSKQTFEKAIAEAEARRHGPQPKP